MCKASGGSHCARVEKAAFALLRALLCASNKLDETLASDHDAALRFHTTFEQWCGGLAGRVQDATDRVDMAAKASPLHRCVRVVAIRKNLTQAALEMETLLAEYTNEFLPCLEANEQRRVKLVLECVRAHYATYEVERDMRVRDMQEEKLALAIRSKLQALHKIILMHGEELCKQHDADRARCAKIGHRMDSLGLDLAARPASVKLKPLPHSPRLLARSTADIDAFTHAEMGRLRSVPDDPRLRFSHVNNHQYFKHEPALPGLTTGILMDEAVDKELPRRKALDDFRKTTDWALADEHRLALEALAKTCFCNTQEIVQDLQALNCGELGFQTRHLGHVALHTRPSKGVIFAYLHLEGSPAKYFISLTHQREDRGDDDANQSNDAFDPWDTVDDPDEVRQATTAAAELQRMRRVIRYTLHIEHYSRLLNESNGNRVIRRLKDVRPGDTIAVDAAADQLRTNLRVFLAQANAHEVADLLARHLAHPNLVAIACQALSELLSSDDFAGSADPTRRAFLHEGGVNMLLSVVDIYRSVASGDDDNTDAAAAALQTLHTLANWREDALRQELLMHKAVARCASALYDLNAHPLALQHACGVIRVLTESESGREAVLRLPESAAYLCEAMLSCPVKRAFAPAQRLACECVANVVLENEANAAALVAAPNDVGVRFLSEVITRAPGNVSVYRSVCAALGRLARFEGRALLRCKAIALETVIHAMQRFLHDEHIQVHGLMTLAYTVQHARHQRQFILCKAQGFDRIAAVLDEPSLREAHWRAAYALCELVRGRGPRRRCSRHVLEAMHHDGIVERLVDLACPAAARSASANAIQGKPFTCDPRLVFWTFRFLRYLVRSCTREHIIRPMLDAEPLDSSASEGEGQESDDEAQSLEASGDPSQRDTATQDIPAPPPEPEVCTRGKEESLASFLKRQAIADAKAKELQDAYLKALEEAKLPPAELREAWRTMLSMLGPDREAVFARAVNALAAISTNAPATREGMHLVYVWLQAEENVLAASPPEVARALALRLSFALHSCRHEVTVIEMLAQTFHLVLDLVAEALAERMRQQREHDALVAQMAREREARAQEASSVFAEIYRTLDGRASLDVPPPDLPPPPAWAAACLEGLAEGAAQNRLETARVRFAAVSPPLVASLGCLQVTVRRLSASAAPVFTGIAAVAAPTSISPESLHSGLQ
ncbi:Hypothetical Protein FCC1311_097622 [Hondaea fermentalgiana]|uniref:Uncharacterized protein n=1 Tax=Hondaea fermentalgiana TaxID=2315210 RepID=A0A2R5GT88_9STRA|nr:Hypothetical Protein FCC1311_097622 [Hondaea fermentalgiana]|eukprot:GBG33539.1 Hypothetical Protein FCC1311_097622 [Hondaea fermentalgiana]